MTETQLAQFHADLQAAVSMKAPLQLEHRVVRKSKSRLMTQLRVCHQQAILERQLSNKDTLEQGARATPKLGDLPPSYLAALDTFSATGRMTPVLEALTVRGIARQQLVRLTRWPLFYVSIVLLLCAIGLYFHSQVLLPQLVQFREDTPKSTIQVGGWDYQQWLPTLYLAIWLMGGLLTLFLITGGFVQILMRFGGRQYIDAMAAVISQRNVSLLLDAGLAPEQAVLLCCQLGDIDQATRKRYFPARLPRDPKAWLQMSEYWWLNAQQRLARSKMFFPILVVSVIGGMVALVYGIAIYGTVVAVIRDLPFAGV